MTNNTPNTPLHKIMVICNDQPIVTTIRTLVRPYATDIEVFPNYQAAEATLRRGDPTWLVLTDPYDETWRNNRPTETATKDGVNRHRYLILPLLVSYPDGVLTKNLFAFDGISNVINRMYTPEPLQRVA
jgi:hypothetical protein